MLKAIKSNIPNFITCLNLISGIVACIFTFSYGNIVGGLTGCQWVWIFIGASAVFDFCDGAAARLLHAYSDLGKELDSLSDLISFGLAPALLLFNLTLAVDGALSWWAFIPLLIAVAGAIRLARFNTQNAHSTDFQGLPIPANAIFWIGFTAWVAVYGYPGHWISSAIILFISFLMISRLRMFSLKFTNFAIADNIRRYFILLAAVIFFCTTGIAGFAWTIILYIVISAFSGRNSNGK